MGMKYSGIEWIGEIPEEWKVKKIKYVSNLYTGNSISDDEKGYYEDSEYAFPYIATKDVSAEDSSIDYENGMYTKQNDHSFRIAPENSTLMCIEGGSAGKKIAKTNQKVSFVNKLCCFNAKKINANYLYMYLKSEAFKEEFNQHISGLIGGVSQTELKSFYILLPMEEEQKLIADFLEDKVGKIDDILADLNKQLDILEKYKKSLITEIVTKGLNPNVTMKDSGIDWIGEIPKDWEVKKIKYTSLLTRGVFGHRPRNDPEYYDGSYPFIQTGDVANANKYILEYSQTLSDLGKQVSREFKKGTIAFTLAANVGDAAILAFDSYFPDSVMAIEPIDNINTTYIYYILSIMKEQFLKVAIISTQLNLNVERVGEIKIPITYNLKEQQEIVDFLDKKCGQIDELIKDKKTQIEKMEGYKKSLIYEYVTGKKRVKGVE